MNKETHYFLLLEDLILKNGQD